MVIDYKFVQEAREHFWKDYHERIEGIGFQLSRRGMMKGDDGISIMATIQPYYSSGILKKIRKIIPKEYIYRGERIRIYIFPSVSDLEKKFGV